MQDEMKNETLNLNEELEKALDAWQRPETNTVVKATVDQVEDDKILVSIPGWKDSISIAKKDLADPEPEKCSDIVSVNDVIDVYVVSLSGKEGDTKVSKVRADREAIWKEFDGIVEREEIVEATINREVKGGLVASVRGLRAFIPASQIDLHFVKDLKSYVGQTVETLPIECDVKKQRLVLSRRKVLEREREEKQENLFSTLEEGQELDGTVKRLVDYGAFIDIGGIDGLAHISDLSWDRVKHPSDVLEVGQTLKVKVKSFDLDKKRISLSVKDTLPNPWFERVKKYEENQEIEGKIIKLTKFGAFMEIEPGFDGLIPMGELSNKHIDDASEVVSVGDVVKVKIMHIDTNRCRLSLSMTHVHKNKNEESSSEEKE